MSLIEEKLPVLIDMLTHAARRRSSIMYSSIYDIFDQETPRNDVWYTFEEACRRIAPNNIAIYGALLAEKSTGLPGTGFYEIFRNVRHDEYLRITNENNPQANRLKLEERREIAQLERERVHQHAIENV